MGEYINHPEHYTFCKYECWDVYIDILSHKVYSCAIASLMSNAFKYIWRCDCKKGDYGKNQHEKDIEDLEKSTKYLAKILTICGSSDESTTDRVAIYKYPMMDVLKEIFDSKNFNVQIIDLLKNAMTCIWSAGDFVDNTRSNFEKALDYVNNAIDILKNGQFN